MFHIVDSVLDKCAHAGTHTDFEVFNKPMFSVANISLSYRQVNALDKDNLLKKESNKKGKWRKLSFKEVIYASIVNDLKMFGLTHEQIKPLWEIFFEKQMINNFTYGDVALLCVIGRLQVFLVIDNEGNINLYDPLHYILYSIDSKAHIQIELNSIVNAFLNKIGREKFPVKRSILSEILNINLNSLKPSEEELIKIIRDEKYNAIRIKKKNGDIELVYAKKVMNGETNAKEILKLLTQKDYQDISIIKRDGKIVNLSVEDTYKLS